MWGYAKELSHNASGVLRFYSYAKTEINGTYFSELIV